MEEKKAILIIEDHEVVTWALKLIIEENLPGATFYRSTTFEQGLTILEEKAVMLVILDIDVPGGNSPEMIRKILAIRPTVKILVHSGIDENDYAVKYLVAGADGFVSKKSVFADVFPEALKQVVSGKKYISQATQDVIVGNYLQGSFPAKKAEIELTRREEDVILLLIKGIWTKEIANQLGIGVTTVSTHKQRIFEKLNVQNVVDLYLKVEKDLPYLLKRLNEEKRD